MSVPCKQQMTEQPQLEVHLLESSSALDHITRSLPADWTELKRINLLLKASNRCGQKTKKKASKWTFSWDCFVNLRQTDRNRGTNTCEEEDGGRCIDTRRRKEIEEIRLGTVCDSYDFILTWWRHTSSCRDLIRTTLLTHFLTDWQAKWQADC